MAWTCSGPCWTRVRWPSCPKTARSRSWCTSSGRRVDGTATRAPRIFADPEVSMTGRVFLVDDYPIVRAGLRALVEADPADLFCCGEAASAEDALRQVVGLQPDVVVHDLTLKGANGLELIKGLQAQAPALPVLVLSMHDEAVYAERALASGARGYVMKDHAPAQLRAAIHTVLAGRIHLSPEIDHPGTLAPWGERPDREAPRQTHSPTASWKSSSGWARACPPAGWPRRCT